MKDRQLPSTKKKTQAFWTALVIAPALLWTGCATQSPTPQVSPDEFRAVQQRMEDVERTNGRLMVRVEEMERQAALMQDRIETNRIAMQRQGYLRQREEGYAAVSRNHERPQPAPRTDYSPSGDYRADPTMRQRMDQRGVARIPLSDHQAGVPTHYDEPQGYFVETREPEEEVPGEEIVITNEVLERRFGAQPHRSSPSSSASTPSSSARRAQPPVTSERLPTTEELAEGGAASSNRSHEDLLEIYQDSLARYRAGDYAPALAGFTEFLNAGPRADYVDNALYWIGECHYGLGQYERSVDYFQQILDELPSAGKVPDAMLKMSLAYEQIGDTAKAGETLETLVERYPRSNPGRLGAQRLRASSGDAEE